MTKNKILILIAIFLVGVSSCVKEKFSAPTTTNADPNITANTTIAGLTALYSGSPTLITQNLVLAAVVVGDDKSGNIYKQLAIEDSTGGILLMINASDLYTSYPVGRRLFIKLQGLYLVNYGGAYEIAASVNTDGSFTGISTPNLTQYVFPGKWGINVAPIVVTVPQLLSNPSTFQSELIQLNNVEFITGNRKVPFANGTYNISVSLAIKDCNENQLTVYTSGYADFANSPTPGGNGTMVCIYGVYNATPQLTVRDTTDLNMTGTLCP
jgi:Family of unknown function (DUF5689)